METAPLSLAHSHARNASVETRKSNPTAASEEHDLAAGEFANAAKSTADNEALRTLRLLEQHHLRLAEILKVHPDEAQSLASRSISPQPSEQLLEAASQQVATQPSLASTKQPAQPTSPHGIPGLHRESSSTLASNLATARGIPPTRRRPGVQSLAQLSPQTAEGRVVNPPRRSRLGEPEFKPVPEDKEISKSSLTPSRPRLSDPDVNLASPTRAPLPQPVTAIATEDPFSRFYTTFNNLITTISAPLAFTGLPLNPTETQTPPATENSEKQQKAPQATQPNVNRAADPELARIFSRAALRAAREEHGLAAPAESFYVVPTTGGTMSYAGMLSNARQVSNVTDDDPDAEFVDARETPSRGSPEQSRYSRHRRTGSAAVEAARRGPVGATKTWEELAVENDTLKTVVVDLGDRLRAFELGAQKSSLALHASMRQFSSPSASSMAIPGTGKIPPLPGSAGGPLAGLGAATKALEERVRELEEELKAVKKDNRRLGRENQKYLAVIEKYRERWEALKEGARERVKGTASAAGTESSAAKVEDRAGA